MKKILFIVFVMIGSLWAEVVDFYHPSSEPKGLYIVNIKMDNSNSIQAYRIYCPTKKVRNISKDQWDKERTVYAEDSLKNAGGIIISAYNQICDKNSASNTHIDTMSESDIDIQKRMDNLTIKKSFLITLTTKNYKEARHFAEDLSKKTDIPLKLRGLHYNKQTGLSFDSKTCKKEYFDYPCYLERGRFDDGIYISIEYSSRYKDFTPGYYIVVLASGDDVSKALGRVRRVAPEAYVKSTRVYVGCMH